MGTKKKNEINLAQTTSVLPAKKPASNGEDKTIEEIVKEQGGRPIKDEKDFGRIFGKYPEWNDIDEFLKEVNRPLK